MNERMTPSEGIESRAELLNRALAEHEGSLIRYACSIVHDLERARDVVQDTFIKLYQQEPAHVNTHLKSWLFTVCRNRALDVLRKEKRIVGMEDGQAENVRSDSPDPARALERKDAARMAMSLLDRLSPNQQEVIRLKFQNDLSYKEISEVTHLSVSNVGFLLHTGLKRLREILSRQATEA